MSESAEHTVENEVVLREVNERIAEKSSDLEARGLAESDETSEYLCSCGQRDCDQSVELTLEEFAEAHAGDDRFLVAPGHYLPEIEEVVADHGRYMIVRKKPG
jgi:hypothetical protein